MERHPTEWSWLVVAAIIVMTSVAVAQDDIEDRGSFPGVWHRIAFDSDGRYLLGDGNGYASGTWFHYPQSGWWRQWFYNEPYGPPSTLHREIAQSDLSPELRPDPTVGFLSCLDA